jgi:thioredoxin-like negative regulator of GroEL
MKYSGMFSGAMPDAAGSSAGGLIDALGDLAQELFAEEAHGLFRAGEYGEALTAFNRIKPEYAATHADTILPELAVCLWHSGDREAARQVMAEARRLIAELPEADHAPLAAAALLIEGE